MSSWRPRAARVGARARPAARPPCGSTRPGGTVGSRHRCGLCAVPGPARWRRTRPIPSASPVGGGLLTLCVAELQPDGARHVDGGLQLDRSGRGRSTRCRSSSTWPTPCPASHRRAGPPWAVPARRAWTGASRSSRPRPSPSAPTSWPTSAATAATPTPATSPARPTAAPSTRRRRASPPPTTPQAR